MTGLETRGGQGHGFYSWLARPPHLYPSCCAWASGTAMQLLQGCPQVRVTSAHLKSLWHLVAIQLQTSLEGLSFLLVPLLGLKIWLQGQAPCQLRCSSWCRIPSVSLPYPTSLFPSACVTSGGHLFFQRVILCKDSSEHSHLCSKPVLIAPHCPALL